MSNKPGNPRSAGETLRRLEFSNCCGLCYDCSRAAVRCPSWCNSYTRFSVRPRCSVRVTRHRVWRLSSASPTRPACPHFCSTSPTASHSHSRAVSRAYQSRPSFATRAVVCVYLHKWDLDGQRRPAEIERSRLRAWDPHRWSTFRKLRIRQCGCERYSLDHAVITGNFDCGSGTCAIRAEIEDNAQEDALLIWTSRIDFATVKCLSYTPNNLDLHIFPKIERRCRSRLRPCSAKTLS